MKKLFTILFMTLALSVLAQQTGGGAQVKIDVTIVDENGESLPGATVKASDKSMGVVSDVNGKVSLWASKGATLTISYVGMKTRKLKVTRPLSGDIALENATATIDQVVVTGYSQTDIRKSTGSVGILTEKDLKDQPLANVDMLMQGKLAGVNVQAVSGRPGESAKIRIRGTSTITGNNEPLWVVDGVPLQKNIPEMGSRLVRSGDFSTLYANGVAGIAPQNIESITVLKDAAAAAIYGSHAQAGVIVITTKKGKAGKLHIGYSGNMTIQTSPSRDNNLMNTEEKLAYEQSIWDEFSAEGFRNGTYFPRIGIIGQIRSGYGKFSGMSTAEQDAYIEELKQTNTDWFKELFRNTVSTSHDLSFSGGSDKLTYYVSGGMNTNKGIVKKSSSDAAHFMSKISANPSKALSMNFDVSYSYMKSIGASADYNMFSYAYYANPYEKPYNDDGSYRADETYFTLPVVNGATAQTLPPDGFNIMHEIDGTKAEAISSSLTVRGDITYRLGEHFRLYGLASYTYSNDNSDSEIGQDTYQAWKDRPFEGANVASQRIYGSLQQSTNYNRSWQARAQLNYGQTFNDIHRVSALVGSEVTNNYSKSFQRKVYGYDPVTGNFSYPLPIGLNSDYYTPAEMQSYQSLMNSMSDQSRIEDAFASFYGAVDYVLLNRYVANFTARSDGSNNFGSKEQFNMTWSAGLAWNMDEESWMDRIRHIVSHATIRLSTGVTGGVNKSVYPVLIMNYSSYFHNSDTQAYRMGYISSPPNAHLRWERTRDYNGSLDIGFLKNRLNMNLSFYRKKGYDLVSSVAVVTSTGFGSQSYNTSEQLNQGVELMLSGTPLKTKDWRWNLSGNISYNQNVLTKYVSPSGSMYGDIYVDYPLSKIFSGRLEGIDAEKGIYTFKKRADFDEENPYAMENYYAYIGTSNYPWTGGLSTNLGWRNLSLSVSSTFSLGAKIRNYITPPSTDIQRRTTNYLANTRYNALLGHYNNVKAAAYRWTEANPVTDGYPRLIDPYGKDLNMDREMIIFSSIHDGVFYENGSYWKISSMTLSYNFPGKLIRRLYAESLGLSFTANNLWIITKYKGLNPETPGAVYPMSRSFSFGLNIGF